MGSVETLAAKPLSGLPVPHSVAGQIGDLPVPDPSIG
jgi:hypothetical protein